MPKLNDASVGSVVTVQKLESTGILRERTLALGLTKGAKVEVIRKGPSGEFDAVLHQGRYDCAQNEESSLIAVQI